MWNKLSIKWQLILFMTILVTLVEVSTLLVIYQFQKNESTINASNEITTITKSLKKDFLEVLLAPNTDNLSDIQYRLNAFENLNGILLLNDQQEAIFQHKSIKILKQYKLQLQNTTSVSVENDFLVNEPLELDGYTFGYVLLDVDLQKLKAKQKEITNTILIILPFALIFSFFISLFLSKSYTQPFTQLIQAMKNSNPINGKIIAVQTNANNEIKDLFHGFNTLMSQVMNASKALQHQAEHDQLTSIKNRFFMEKSLEEALKNEIGTLYNLLYINLDQFKLINDAAGHQAGDELLKMIANKYSESLPKNAIFARYDGDAFMVLLKDSSQEEGEVFLEHTKNELSDFRFSADNTSYSVSASIGFVHFKAFEYTFNELIKAINSALRTAKSMGHNKTCIFHPQDNISKRFNIELATAGFIKEALLDGPSKFELFAQDIVPLQYETDKVSYEILIRMWDKENNFIPPDDFLPTAQRYQRMHEIDIWVLWTYLQTVTKSPEHLEKLHSAHINLAGSSLTNPDFQAKVKEAVMHFNFPWNKLELEVTETSAVGNFSKANEFIQWLKNVGIGLALDDFGTGMASFEYLKSMPFDVVKIDGSFVKDMHDDPIDKAVIKYIHEISELKGQETVAEYVETQKDVDELTKIGITYGQGYFLGKPKPLREWL